MTTDVPRRVNLETRRTAIRQGDDFGGLLTHELRNRLAPMHHGLRLLQEAAGGRESVTAIAEILQRQVTQLTHMVERLQDVALLDHDLLELRTEEVELGDVVHAAIETVRPLLTPGRQVLSISLPPDSVRFEADRARLTQIIANLLENALKFGGDGGGVRLTARVRRWKHQADDVLIISVRDGGIGISAEKLPKVFDMPATPRDAGDVAHGGLGLGLVLVRKLVERHGGSVAVESEGVGCGSEFIVRLPMRQGQPAIPWHSISDWDDQALAEPAHQILVVDDNCDAAETLAMLLRKAGADIQVVYSGESAMAAMHNQAPDAVLLDLGMPGMTGYQLASFIRNDPALQHVTLVALTGCDSEGARERAREAGIDRYLVKPVDFESLRQLLNLRSEFVRPRSTETKLRLT